MTQEQWIRSFCMQLQDVQSRFATLHRNAVKACNSAGFPISPECLLLMVLQWCARGSYLDCMALYRVSKAAFFENLWAVLFCITEAVPVVFRMDSDSCQSSADCFRLKQRNDVFRHVVGAVDWILVACQCPSLEEYPRPAQFFTHKGFYRDVFNCQAVCDAN